MVGQFGPFEVQTGSTQVELPALVGQDGPLWVQLGLPGLVGQVGPLWVQPVFVGQDGPTLVHGSPQVFTATVGHFGPASVQPSMIVPQPGPLTVCIRGAGSSAGQVCVVAIMRPSRKLALGRSVTTGP